MLHDTHISQNVGQSNIFFDIATLPPQPIFSPKI